MPQPYRIQINLDCTDAHTQADWWAQTLGWAVEPTDPDFIQQMIDQGFATEADTQIHRNKRVWRGAAAICRESDLGDPQRQRIVFQEVPEAKTVKNRMHLDVATGGEDIDEVRERLVARGATYLESNSQGPHAWHVMQDPEGNEFCVSP